jgi:hypothetical protein
MILVKYLREVEERIKEIVVDGMKNTILGVVWNGGLYD